MLAVHFWSLWNSDGYILDYNIVVIFFLQIYSSYSFGAIALTVVFYLKYCFIYFFNCSFSFEYLSHSLGSLDSFETLITSNLWTCTSFGFYLKFWVLLVAEIKSSPNRDDQPWSVSGWIVAYISVTYIQLKLLRLVIMITFFYILSMSISQQQKKSRITLNLMEKNIR